MKHAAPASFSSLSSSYHPSGHLFGAVSAGGVSAGVLDEITCESGISPLWQKSVQTNHTFLQ